MTGLLSLAQARPKAQGLQVSRPCSTSGRRHPAKLRHSQCSFYAIFNVGFTLGILGATLAQPPDQRIARILGHAFRSRPLPENASRSECSFRDVVSARGPTGKARPGLEAESGMQFPRGADPETASHSGAEIWDAVSARGRKGKAHPIPSINSEARFVIPARTSQQTKSAWCLPCSPQPPDAPA